MDQKIKIEDLIDELPKEQNTVHQLIKEDLLKITNKPTKQRTFYDLIPTTELEKNIKEVLEGNNIQKKRREKNVIFEFDRKMARINKIKSRNYRKMRRKEKSKLKELNSLYENENSASEKEDGSSEKEEVSEDSESNNKNVGEISDTSDNENKLDFVEEKRAEVEKCLEEIKEIVLPGWGTWGGEGLETKKSKCNTIKEVKEGIEREDINIKNVIINPNKPKLDEKYSSNIPNSMSKSNFNKIINASVSKECNSLRVFNLFVKSKNKKEEIAEEFIYDPLEE